MTLLRRDIHDELVRGFERIDDTFRVRLTAERETLRHRIVGCNGADDPREWLLAHLDPGHAASADPHFGVEIDTTSKDPDDVADAIAQAVTIRNAATTVR